jgi:CRP-like cAMP-binding protein
MNSTKVSWEDSVFFKDSPKEVLQKIRSLIKESSFQPGSVIFKEGESANSLYLLKSGSVELKFEVPTQPDVSVRITLVHPGEIFAWSSLTGGKQFTATAVAAEESEVFTLCSQDLRRIMDSEPRFGYQVMDRLANLVASRLKDTRRQLQWLNCF